VITGIDIVFLHTKDSVKMSQWYKEKLGIDISFVADDKKWIEFRLPEHHPSTRFAIEHIGTLSSKVEQQPIMVSFRVDDIHKTIEEFESMGVEFHGFPKIREEGVSYYSTIRDPDGNWIQISQRK
jgi:extradiol dioxygenase family protein